MDQQTEVALKHLSENIFKAIVESNRSELSATEWEYMCIILGLDFHKSVYCIEPTPTGFVLRTRRLSFIYNHAPSRYQSKLAVKKETDTIPVKLPFKLIEIKVHAIDGLGEVTKTFSSVHELAAFLKDNESYAKALGYVAKGKVK